MTDQNPPARPTPRPRGAPPPPAAAAACEGQSPLSVGAEGDVFDEHPELFVAGAFVGGLVLAQVLRRLGPSS